ncbi:MAG: hypothetical protein DU429_04515 [Candidatus Tokpelaia sp.]|nr:MAG: hypothetical protein DU430_00505 [Candidatus Tokpelaia sp.]KAA6206896.1 MAG: hypothetical protein DU429_04515 [Candidatus Tokpelaia sp.]
MFERRAVRSQAALLLPGVLLIMPVLARNSKRLIILSAPGRRIEAVLAVFTLPLCRGSALRPVMGWTFAGNYRQSERQSSRNAAARERAAKGSIAHQKPKGRAERANRRGARSVQTEGARGACKPKGRAERANRRGARSVQNAVKPQQAGGVVSFIRKYSGYGAAWPYGLSEKWLKAWPVSSAAVARRGGRSAAAGTANNFA